jgi:hypothetical protein
MVTFIVLAEDERLMNCSLNCAGGMNPGIERSILGASYSRCNHACEDQIAVVSGLLESDPELADACIQDATTVIKERLISADLNYFDYERQALCPLCAT